MTRPPTTEAPVNTDPTPTQAAWWAIRLRADQPLTALERLRMTTFLRRLMKEVGPMDLRTRNHLADGIDGLLATLLVKRAPAITLTPPKTRVSQTNRLL